MFFRYNSEAIPSGWSELAAAAIQSSTWLSTGWRNGSWEDMSSVWSRNIDLIWNRHSRGCLERSQNFTARIDCVRKIIAQETWKRLRYTEWNPTMYGRWPSRQWPFKTDFKLLHIIHVVTISWGVNIFWSQIVSYRISVPQITQVIRCVLSRPFPFWCRCMVQRRVKVHI